MFSRICITILIGLTIISLASAIPTFTYGDDTEYIYVINQTSANMSDYWDALDTPADIEHNDLASIDGGDTGEYYHLTAAIYNNIMANITSWITDVSNYFTKAEAEAEFYNRTTIDSFNDSWRSTYNASYAEWAYNQSDGGSEYNDSWINDSHVPYTGATDNIELGNKNITLNGTLFVSDDEQGYNHAANAWGMTTAYIGELIISVLGPYGIDPTGTVYAHLGYFDDDIYVTGNVTADWIKGKVNYSDVQNHPAIGSEYNDSWINNTYLEFNYNMTVLGGGSGDSYDQSLNQSDNVRFNTIETNVINSTTGYPTIKLNVSTGNIEAWL